MTIATEERITTEVTEQALAFQIVNKAAISAIRDLRAAADLATLVDAQNEVRKLMEVRETARAVFFEAITQPTISFSDLATYEATVDEFAEVLAR